MTLEIDINITPMGLTGKENDNYVMGTGNWQDYGQRDYMSRIGRFPSVDPIDKQYQELSSYQYASDSPIQATDRDGKEADFFTFAKAGIYGETVQKIVKGTEDGMNASLSNTYHFITRDAWKESTWEQAGHFLDEVMLSSSPFNNIYNPNTPILDAAVKGFNDNVVHGDAYTRSKFGSQILTDIATAYVSSKGLVRYKTLVPG